MSTVGIYDLDYFSYEHVLPNLECGKLCAYYKQHNQIAVLAPKLIPQLYTKFFIRKEYDDGNFPQELFQPNVSYGGRAFSPIYTPLDYDIETTLPDMSIYEKYASEFSSSFTGQSNLSRYLRAAHIRISLDGKHIDERLFDKIEWAARQPGIIFHDYDLSAVEDAYTLVYDLSHIRHQKDGTSNPYTVGNKYPIRVHNADEMQKWLDLRAMYRVFYLQYDGIMEDELMVDLIKQNKDGVRQLCYDVTYGFTDEEDFVVNQLPKIYKQCIFLQRNTKNFSLKYNEDLLVTRPVKNFVRLLDVWLRHYTHRKGVVKPESLYYYCSLENYHFYRDALRSRGLINPDDMRESFLYMAEHNRALFNSFYCNNNVELRGGKFEYV